MRECDRCGTEFSDEKSLCTSCGKRYSKKIDTSSIRKLSDIEDVEIQRCETGEAWDTVLGGGFVPGAVFMIGGEPGAGKSTMMLQITEAFDNVGYIAAEESGEQIKSRAVRLGNENMEGILIIDALGGNEKLPELLTTINVDLLILDSLQGLVGLGEGANERAVAALRMIKDFAVGKEIPAVVLEHVNKDGDLAGLMTFQHFVDGTFLLLVDHATGNRTFKSMKNRHGPAPVEEVFEMLEDGLFCINDDKDDDDDLDDSEDSEEETDE